MSSWTQIKISIEYGYFGGMPPVTITCYNDGDLRFKAIPGIYGPLETIDDFATIMKSSIEKLDKLVQQIEEMTSLEIEGFMCDGPSFECTVNFENGVTKGFSYVAQVLSPQHKQLEKDIRKILREQHFLRKHRESFFPK